MLASSSKFNPDQNVAQHHPAVVPITDLPEQRSTYHKAPMLAGLVVRGELPPVEQRLPKYPFIRKADSIGLYGGTLYDQTESQGGRFFLDGALIAGPQETDNDGKIHRPHLCDGIEFDKDYKEFVFHIREGLKWSDGVELTADDVLW